MGATSRRRHFLRRKPRRGAMHRVAAALAGTRDPLLNSATISGGAVSGEPELNGGAGLYSSRSWIASAVLPVTRIDTSVSAKSMPAVTPPPVTRLRSTQTRVFVGSRRIPPDNRSPSSVSPRDSLEQAGRAQYQRSRADRGDVFCTHRLPAQEVQHLLIVDHVVGAGAAGHADHVELRAVGKCGGGRQRQHGVARHRLDPFPDQVQLRARHAGKYLHRAGEVELGHLGKDQKTDLERRGTWAGLSKFCLTRISWRGRLLSEMAYFPRFRTSHQI